jgi:hypothetical protein
MKTGPDALGTVENESCAQYMKTGPDALRTIENEYGRTIYEKRDPTPSVSPKTSLGAQNMKKGPEALGTAENESGSPKHENGIRRPRFRRKRVRARKTRKTDPTPSEPSKTTPGAQNMKTGPDALGVVENESELAKHEKRTRRPRFRRKGVRERKT